MKGSLTQLMSVNGGFVDTAGFLALQGLFSAHVTGNFVTFGAAIVHGTSGAATKLLALPVFCAVVLLVRLASFRLSAAERPVLRSMLVLMTVLLTAAGACAISFGPFTDGDHWTAMVTGMTLVSAMAIQNAVHRVHLATAPPTTLMTGTTTQIMIDIADLLHGLPTEAADGARRRIGRMSASVLAFAAGCALAAILYVAIHLWCFVVPPLLAFASVLLQGRTGEGEAA